MKELRIVGPLHGQTGYCRHGRGLLSAALAAGYTVEAVETDTVDVVTMTMDGVPVASKRPVCSILSLPQCQRDDLVTAVATKVAIDAPTIILTLPQNMGLYPEYSAGPRIGVTMIETDTVHPRLVQGLRNVDLMLCPSDYVSDAFRRAMPDTDVQTLFAPVDARLWGPAPADPGRIFRFLGVGSMQERKYWRQLIQGFAEEFRGEPVELVCHVTAPDLVGLSNFVGCCRAMGANITLDGTHLDDAQLRELYGSSDCQCLPGCEGFGLPIVEAGLCGVPSIGLAGGAQADKSAMHYASTPEASVGVHPYLFPSTQTRAGVTIKDVRVGLRLACEAISRGAIDDPVESMQRFTVTAIAPQLDAMVQRAIANWEVFQGPYLTRADLPEITYCMTTYNHADSTERAIKSILLHTPKARILIADDGSTDETADMARMYGVEVIECGRTGNIAYNRNQAIPLISPDSYVAFCDNDIEVTPDTWPGVLSVFDQYEHVGVAFPAHRGPDGRLQHTGAFMQPSGGIVSCMLERPVNWIDASGTSFLVIRPGMTEQLFDEQFEIFHDDMDYCYSQRANGWDVASTTRGSVIHYASTTSSSRALEGDMRRRAFLRKWKDVI